MCPWRPFSAKLPFALHLPFQSSFTFLGNCPFCEICFSPSLNSNLTFIHSGFVRNNSSQQCTFLRASFYKSVTSSTVLCPPLRSVKLWFFSLPFFLVPFLRSLLFLCLFLMPNTLSSSLLHGPKSSSCSSSWDQLCESVASCRRDWRLLGLLRPHCSSWQGRSWELFNSRRIGGSASYRHPRPHTYT